MLLEVGTCTYAWLNGETGLFGDVGLAIVYVNETDQLIEFYGQHRGGRPFKDTMVGPHATRETHAMITGPGTRIFAKRPDGKVAFDRTYTWNELSSINGRIVINSLDPIE